MPKADALQPSGPGGLPLLLSGRFLAVAVFGWLFMFLAPVKWFIDWYLPYSFHLLNLGLVLGIGALGGPLVHPSASGLEVVVRGLLQSILSIFLGLIFYSVGVQWVGMPEPGGVYFGITLFGSTLWYFLSGVGPFPFGPPGDKLTLVENAAFAWTSIMTMAIVIFMAFCNFDDTPIAGDATNPHGIFESAEWFDRMVWIIVWVQAFGSSFCFQGWPFCLAKTPWYQASFTFACIVLGTACYEFAEGVGIKTSFHSSAVGGTLISFTVYHAVGFDLMPFASRFIQPVRGCLNFLLEEVVLTALWIPLCRGILKPMENRVKAAGPPYDFLFDINNITAWYSLHCVALFLLIHQTFFLRYPLPPAGPPIGPLELAPKVPGGAILPGGEGEGTG